VRLVVPFTPGGSTDIVAGIITQKLVEFWGQQFVIDNRPGAGGAIGAETVARAAPEKFGAFMRSEAERLKPLVVAGTLQIE
jgi:tripartite-type tricarboxylate transporter receptor subunit TctC